MEKEALREQIRAFIGIKPEWDVPDFCVMDEQACDGYTRLLICYPGSEDDDIPAYLLVPEGEGPFPAVLVHHQHNGERHLGKSEVCGLAGNPLQAFGVELVKRGFMVLAPDSICFEDRRPHMKGIVPDEKNDFMYHFNEMCYRIVKGSSLMKKVIDDANIGFSLLKQHPKADKHRIGVLGHSYGGNTVLFQMALNEEIAFGCSSGAACTYKRKMQAGTGIEMAEVIPGFYQKYDITDLVKCMAPRPILLVSATEDKYSSDADEIVSEARPVFDQYHAADKLVHLRYQGGHALTEERFKHILDWLAETASRIS
ncbi:MAG TPA: alpha/beta hydrolase family protein [Thermoclostridium caenicola]|uniref:Dienelactone hydrolase n=1 Tax=Thermoclostridium caenicola TaxID=659425 RepID=A0A1M6JD99_9FIRM|nr:alpha/beta hydrolase family protein [Thermoclostridium caenicola]SHJ44687.1 Dienelactone hydrolase [Thermoclostridium caenicola]HOK42382.1 alpha/beta hydrolase family protein [Thermoclostridium caenicola]HOL83837.1 alpha/beta hydrolase family protein [Thermoclostridium caenicola]HPO77798.1 alpha/beta hydrolase family protein [Thermoclostridium caenicola]